jgi:hypothetical protein
VTGFVVDTFVVEARGFARGLVAIECSRTWLSGSRTRRRTLGDGSSGFARRSDSTSLAAVVERGFVAVRDLVAVVERDL